MSGAKKFAVGLGLALLLSALGLVAYGTLQPPENRFTGTVRVLLPEPQEGWTMIERPIADSPEMRRAVGEILNFDDAVFVDYTSSGGDRLSVYVAYWQTGKMTTKDVARHTPDVCWINNGWKRVSASQITTWGSSEMSIPAGESRVFSIGGTEEQVVFWHIVGSRVVSYGIMGRPPWYAVFNDVLRNGLFQRQEQFFIRLSSGQSLDSETLRPLTDQIIKGICDLAPESLLTNSDYSATRPTPAGTAAALRSLRRVF